MLRIDRGAKRPLWWRFQPDAWKPPKIEYQSPNEQNGQKNRFEEMKRLKLSSSCRAFSSSIWRDSLWLWACSAASARTPAAWPASAAASFTCIRLKKKSCTEIESVFIYRIYIYKHFAAKSTCIACSCFVALTTLTAFFHSCLNCPFLCCASLDWTCAISAACLSNCSLWMRAVSALACTFVSDGSQSVSFTLVSGCRCSRMCVRRVSDVYTLNL